MHQVMKTSSPPIAYKSDVTISCVAEIENLRAAGHELFYTIDAGPQVKIICDPKSSKAIKETITEKKYCTFDHLSGTYILFYFT